MAKTICLTCAHWNQGAPESATATRCLPMNMDLGTCELFPPSIVEGKWFHGTYYPRTHFSRTCGDWTPDFDPTDPDGGQRAPEGSGTVATFGALQSVVVPFEKVSA